MEVDGSDLIRHRMVVTGSYDGSLRVWTYDAETKEAPKCLQIVTSHTSYINSIVFDETGEKLYTAHASGLIKVFDASLDEAKNVDLKCISTVDIFMVSSEAVLIKSQLTYVLRGFQSIRCP
jgi:WD40 repeat protein